MPIYDGSTLNDVQRALRDILELKLDTRATITKLRQDGDAIEIEVVSPNHFTWTAEVLHEVAGRAAQTTKCRLDVRLLTSWFAQKQDDDIPRGNLC